MSEGKEGLGERKQDCERKQREREREKEGARKGDVVQRNGIRERERD